MEIKKTERADLSNKTPLFFSIGLFTSLLITVMVFENKTFDEQIDLSQQRNADQMEELLDIPQTEQLPPPPPPVQQPQVIEVPDDEKIEEEIQVDLDVESTDETRVEQVVIKHEIEEVENVDEIFTIVEEQATPVGGMAAFYKYIGNNLKYPAQARRMNIEGRVYCAFVVNKDGSIQDVKVLRGLGAGCDEEAARVISQSPPWTPGKQRGRPVRSRYQMFINFKMR